MATRSRPELPRIRARQLSRAKSGRTRIRTRNLSVDISRDARSSRHIQDQVVLSVGLAQLNAAQLSRWLTLAQPCAPDLGIGSAVPGDQGRSRGYLRGARGRRPIDLIRPRITSTPADDAPVISLAGDLRRASDEQIVVGDVPQQPAGFQARAALLAELERIDTGVSVLHAPTGMRGTGKTQLAAAYAQIKLAGGWRLVAWINAEEISSVHAGLVEIANCIGLPGSVGRDAIEVAQELRQVLKTDGHRHLIVFDNAADPDVLRPYIPADGASRVLIISDRRSLTNLGADVVVDRFTAEEALIFLAARTGVTDISVVQAVAAELEYIPLGLAHAAAVISTQKLACETYLERLQSIKISDYPPDDSKGTGPDSAIKAVLLSLDAVRSADKNGLCIAILRLMAVLSSSGVRRDLLDAAAESGVLPGPRHRTRWGTSAMDRALTRLVEHSLVTLSRDKRRISVHPFVMRVVRDQLTRQERLAAVCRTAAYLVDIRAGKVESSSERAEVRDVLLHINALLRNTWRRAAAEDDELAGMLLSLHSWALYHLNELGDSVSQAVVLGESLVTDLELNRGRHHLDTLGARNNLAAAYQAAGRLDKAIPLFEETLASREQILGHDHPDAMASRNNLAAAYQAAGRLDEAIPLFEETLTSREKILGHDHPSTATSWSNLGLAYSEAGWTTEAIALFDRTLEARKHLLAAGHPETLTAWNDLNLARQEAARAREAD